MNNITAPKTTRASVLYDLLLHGKTSIEQFYWMPSFRTRISELKRKVELTGYPKSKKNQFGHTYTYHVHVLPTEQKETALKLYNEINK